MVCKPATFAVLAVGLAAFGSVAVCAQPDAEDRTFERAGRIASQPARDVGIAKDKIAPVLQEAVGDAYRLPGGGCSGLTAELARLDQALGPDLDAHVKGDDRATQLAETGSEMVVNSLIPLRGIVREVSGAASADRRKAAAINAGLARRGFLRGLAEERSCPVPVTAPAR